MEMDSLDIVDVLDDCLGGYRSDFQKRGVELTLGLDTMAPLIKGNRAALRQVFNSLISNAIEAMPTGGALSVTAVLESTGDSMLVRITDTGTGIPDGQIGRILEAFVTTKGSGVGIGLTLAQRIIERHSGELQLTQADGHGVVASVRIPVVG